MTTPDMSREDPKAIQAADILNLAGQATWIEQAPHNGTLWREQTYEERAYWSARAYPSVMAATIALAPGDGALHAYLAQFYDAWKAHGLVDLAKARERAGRAEEAR